MIIIIGIVCLAVGFALGGLTAFSIVDRAERSRWERESEWRRYEL